MLTFGKKISHHRSTPSKNKETLARVIFEKIGDWTTVIGKIIAYSIKCEFKYYPRFLLLAIWKLQKLTKKEKNSNLRTNSPLRWEKIWKPIEDITKIPKYSNTVLPSDNVGSSIKQRKFKYLKTGRRTNQR